MNDTYSIELTDCGPLGSADRILIFISGFNILDKECIVNYSLINSQTRIKIGQGWKKLEGSDYDNWGHDNTYIKDWLLNQLNITEA